MLLDAGTEKLTFSALMEFDTQGNMTHYEFRKAVINSKVRGVYSEVNEILAGTASQQLLDKYAPVMDSLMAAYELFHVFQRPPRPAATWTSPAMRQSSSWMRTACASSCCPAPPARPSSSSSR